MSEYQDYNWINDNFVNAHTYLLKPLLELLPKDNSPILDLGCGNGAIVNYLIAEGYNAYGTDASLTGINIANIKNSGRFFLQDLSKDDLPNELQSIKFKIIISTEVIEHLYNPRKYIEFCKNILEKSGGGYLIISTPYHGFLKNLLLSLLNAWDRHFTALWVGGHIKFWSYKTLSKLLNEYGFKVVSFKGCGRIPFLWKSMIIKAKI